MARRTQIDQRLAEELARGNTLAKAAEAAGCSLATAKRRWSEPTFRRRVIQLQDDARRERQALAHASWHLGVRLLPVAMAALQETLQDRNASHLDKARAARILLRSFGPREEPPTPAVPTVEDEQQQQRQTAQFAQLLEQFSGVVDLNQRRPQAPQPPAAAWTPPAPAGAWPIGDGGEEPAAGVGRGSAKMGPAELQGPPEDPADPDGDDPVEAPMPAAAVVAPAPEPEPEPVAQGDKADSDEVAQARQFLRYMPRRPPAGPELVAWLRARQVVGLDVPPESTPPPRQRYRRRRTPS